MPRLLIRISRFYLMFSAVSLRNTDSTGAVLIGDLLIRVTTRQRFSATFDVSALPFVCECWIYGLVPNWSEPLSKAEGNWNSISGAMIKVAERS